MDLSASTLVHIHVLARRMTSDWSRKEVVQVVSDYLDMLRMDLADERFIKAEHNRHLQEVLPGRTRGSIEFKHQNISAVLVELGFPYVDGYRPMANYQELLREVVVELLDQHPTLSALVRQVVASPADRIPDVSDILGMLVDPPVREEKPGSTREGRPTVRRGSRQPNYLKLEAGNRSLGLAGEGLVLQFEHRRLCAANKKSLAERIDHVSRTQGDGLGYDIESFDESGRPRLIEVKTTRFGAMTPFFVSRNEVDVSVERTQDYYLYRVFDFRSQPKLFTLPGSIDSNCILDSIQYRASVR